jgi:hypothetical protein
MGRPPFRQVREVVRRVQADGSVDLDTNHYSVPWRLIGARVRVEVDGWRGAHLPRRDGGRPSRRAPRPA